MFSLCLSIHIEGSSLYTEVGIKLMTNIKKALFIKSTFLGTVKAFSFRKKKVPKTIFSNWEKKHRLTLNLFCTLFTPQCCGRCSEKFLPICSNCKAVHIGLSNEFTSHFSVKTVKSLVTTKIWISFRISPDSRFIRSLLYDF